MDEAGLLCVLISGLRTLFVSLISRGGKGELERARTLGL